MTDRELLELAAKAAGIRVPNKKDYPYAYMNEYGIHRDVSLGGDGSKMSRWNPLEDDGDALRLAVKLKIDVAHTNIHAPQVHALADSKVQEFEDSSSDQYAATRRAIVRAAAAIGKAMP